MKSVLVARAHALMGSVSLRFAIMLLGLVGYCGIASAVNPGGGGGCTAFTPEATLLVTSTSYTYPGNAAITANAILPATGQCSTSLVSLAIFVNGTDVKSSSSAQIAAYALSNLNAGTYSIYSHAFYVSGATASSATQTITIAPQAQSINLSAPAAQTVGNPNFAVSAVSSLGFGVTITAAPSNVCNMASATSVSIAGIGSCTIYATQPGDANHAAASASQTVIIKANQTINLTTINSQTYLGPNFTVNANASSGLTNTITASPSNVCMMATSTSVQITGAGTCTIIASQGGNASYNAAPSVSQNVTINQAPQSINFTQPADHTLGAAAFNLVATSTSNSLVQFTSATSSICTVSGTTVTMNSGGTCTINANANATTNYLVAPQTSISFMVNVAPTIAVSGPGDGSAYTPFAALTFTASETPGTYTISSITYYDTNSGTVLCSGSTAPWSCTDSVGLASGSYAIYAIVNTTNGLSVTSLPITVTVGTGTGAPVSSSTPIPVTGVTAPSTGNAVAGTLPGGLTASINGGSAYDIPLSLPPGVAGMTPSLALDYNSQQANGFLGLGWSLSGMSSIHRCGKTLAQDNTASGVSFATSDRLCLDGQRLILVSAGTGATGNPDADYWTVGATYSTEIANFSRITSYASAKGLAFKVETKSGRVLFYGDQGDSTSYITAQGRSDNQAVVWALGQVQDLSGNYFIISYTNNATTGEYLPAQINYGGNNQTGLASHLSVVFNFVTTRIDSTVRFVAGSHNDMVSLISSIKVYNGIYSSANNTATEVREYDFTYTNSPSSGRSLIASVDMQALNPQSNTLVAFPSTTFSYNQSGAMHFTEASSGATSGPVASYVDVLLPGATTSAWTFDFTNIVWADFNGDGMTDAMVVNTRVTPWQYNIYLAKSGGGFAAPIVWMVPTSIAATIASRFNTETSVTNPHQTEYEPILNTLANNNSSSGWGLVGDFNGDGSSDLFLFGGFVCLSQLKNNPIAANSFVCTDSGTNTGVVSGMGASLVSWNAEDYLVMNTTGSQLSDILVKNIDSSVFGSAEGTRCVSHMSSGTQSFTCGTYANTNYVISGVANPPIPTPPANNFIGNFTGSGRQDVYRLNGFLEVCASGDSGFTCSNWGAIPQPFTSGLSSSGSIGAAPYMMGVMTVADANGDGLSDILIPGYVADGGYGFNTVICYSTGKSFACGQIFPKASSDSVVQHIGVIDSDGVVKTLTFEYNAAGTGGSWRSCIIQNSNPELVCQTVSGGPTMPPAPTAATPVPNGALQLGNYLNDGALNLLIYNQSIDVANAKANTYTSSGTAWTPYTLSEGTNVAADQLSTVTNGVGRTDSVTYTQGGQASVYSQYSSSGGSPVFPVYPQISVVNPGYLVSAINTDNGQGGSVQTTYSYSSLVIDGPGRGSFGFATLYASDLQSHINTITNLDQYWPLVGMTSSTQTTYTPTAGTTITIGSTSNALSYSSLPNSYYSGNSNVGGSETGACVLCLRYVSASTATSADLAGYDLGTTTSNAVTYDNFGNLLTSTVSSKLATDSTSFVATMTNTYDNNTGTCVASHGATYVIGRLCSTTITKTNQAGTSITRSDAKTYFASGLIQTETVEPGQTTLPAGNFQVTNTYTRDGFGNILGSTQSWLDPASSTTMSRASSVTYTSDGRFPATGTNALGMTERYVFDNATGVRTQLTDANGLIATWTVDGLGRVTSVTAPDGNMTNSYLVKCQSDCPSNATTIAISTHYNGSSQTTVPSLAYINPIGQVVRSMTYGFSGTPIATDRTFDSRGRSVANYQPVFVSGATAAYPAGILADSVAQDDANRVTSITVLDTNGSNLVTNTSYAGVFTTTVNPAGETRIATKDAVGELVSVQTLAYKSAQATNVSYAYDPFGNTVQTTDPANNVIKVGYDIMGHKTQLNDPDLGVINFSVDPVGRTWKKITPNEAAKATTTTFQYDYLNRLTARIEPDLNSFFSYDSAVGQSASCASTHSCGKLAESYTAPTGSNVGLIDVNNSAKESDTVYQYDSLGRPANNTLTLDASINMTFYNETDYDAWSRPITRISQHGVDPQKIYDMRYNAYGYLQNVQRGGLTLWQALSQDAANRVLMAHLATAGGGTDGLIVTRCFDANTGYVDSTVIATPSNSVTCGTTPAVATYEESYNYDPLGNVQQRTEGWNQGSAGTVATQSFSEIFAYDGLNRILSSAVTSSTNSGTTIQPTQSFSYSVDGNLLTNTAAGNYLYTGGTSGGPHAVKTVSGAATVFTYDADGNQLTGNSHINTWSSFDMPLTMGYTGAGSQFPTNSSQFTYGPFHERRTQRQGSSSIIYCGGAQEVQTDTSHNVQQIKTYWPMGLGVEIDTPSQTASVLNWTHRDHLGSVVAITDIDGNLKEALGYDTWGNRRNAQGAPVSIATVVNAAVNETTDDKGYTGAEQLANLQLVHLNGRVYDPLIGKFISGDPLIADPSNGQNFNRYAYVLNSPMNLIDPTGYADKSCQNSCGGGSLSDPLDSGWNVVYAAPSTTITTFTPTGTTGVFAKDGSLVLTTTYSVSTSTVAGTGDVSQGQSNAYASYTIAFATNATGGATPGSPNDLAGDTWMSFPGKNAVFTANGMGGDTETGPIPQVVVDSAISSHNNSPCGGNGFSCADQQVGKLLYLPAIGATAGLVGAGVTAVATTRMTVVLGHYPIYINLGRALGAQVFNLPPSVYASMSTAEVWEANVVFLNNAMARGADFILATGINAGTYFEMEVDYILGSGSYEYGAVDGMTALVPK